MHVFTKAGLGEAPFKFEELIDLGDRSGTCDLCGQKRLRLQCVIKSSDGKQFVVGSSCVEKSCDYKTASEVRKALQERNVKIKQAKVQEFSESLSGSALEEWLEGMPHPYQNRAKEGKTYLDQIKFCINHEGLDNLIRTINSIKKRFNARK